MIVAADKEIDLFVASKIGSFKHIKYHTESSKNTKKCIENLTDIKKLERDDTITCLEWGNLEQTEILIGRKNQQIQLYDTLHGFTKTYTADFSPGEVVGLGRCKRKLIAATSNGIVRIWSKKVDEQVQTGGKLDRMRVCADDNAVFGTGGQENDLQLYRIGDLEPTFSAKNLAHDWLQLRRPVWVSDLAFMPGEGGRVVAVCSRHGYVRLYDSRAQRRPVINVEFKAMAATCIIPSFGERQVLVGFGRGQLHQVDLRKGKPDKGFKGCAGAVTSIAITKDPELIISTSLDRHLRVHQFESKQLLHKQYLTSKLSYVLAQTESSTPLLKEDTEIKEEEKVVPVELEREDDLDEIFENMETIDERPRKKKLAIEEEVQAKKVKPSSEGSTELGNEEEEEDAIVKLLRSTEKQKKKREKQKRARKAKSVFHNA